MNLEKNRQETSYAGSSGRRQQNGKSGRVCAIAEGKLPSTIVDSIRNSVCAEINDLKKTNGKWYCLFHYPGDKNVAEFNKRLLERLRNTKGEPSIERSHPKTESNSEVERKHYDFRYVVFPDESVVFRGFHFDERPNFGHAVFRGKLDLSRTTFTEGANFTGAHFHEQVLFIKATFKQNTSFESAIFESEAKFQYSVFEQDASFIKSKFSKSKPTDFYRCKFQRIVDFEGAVLWNTSFNSASFFSESRTYFTKTKCNARIKFTDCRFLGSVRFIDLTFSESSEFNFQLASLGRDANISFIGMVLSPHWFVGFDARRLSFSSVMWDGIGFREQTINTAYDFLFTREGNDKSDNRAARRARVASSLEIVYRELALNCEENHRYDDASKFRYLAMETSRIYGKKEFLMSRLLTLLYKWTSAYGESWGQAAIVLFGVWLAFGLTYFFMVNSLLGSGSNDLLSFPDALGASTSTILLQKSDIFAHVDSDLIFTVRIIETIIGPLQIGLLALAIRRKFMRG